MFFKMDILRTIIQLYKGSVNKQMSFAAISVTTKPLRVIRYGGIVPNIAGFFASVSPCCPYHQGYLVVIEVRLVTSKVFKVLVTPLRAYFDAWKPDWE